MFLLTLAQPFLTVSFFNNPWNVFGICISKPIYLEGLMIFSALRLLTPQSSGFSFEDTSKWMIVKIWRPCGRRPPCPVREKTTLPTRGARLHLWMRMRGHTQERSTTTVLPYGHSANGFNRTWRAHHHDRELAPEHGDGRSREEEPERILVQVHGPVGVREEAAGREHEHGLRFPPACLRASADVRGQDLPRVQLPGHDSGHGRDQVRRRRGPRCHRGPTDRLLSVLGCAMSVHGTVKVTWRHLKTKIEVSGIGI